jgi:hypothetical protein
MAPVAPITQQFSEAHDTVCRRRIVHRVRPCTDGLRQGKSPTDAAGACAALSNQDTTKPAAALARAEINVEEKGDEFLIRAQSEVEADGAAIWSTLSDYDHSPGSFPACPRAAPCRAPAPKRSSSRRGSAGLGPFRQRFTVLLAVREEMNQSISASGIGGDFRCFKSRYEIVPLDSQRARIVYQATLVPKATHPSRHWTISNALLDRHAVRCASCRICGARSLASNSVAAVGTKPNTAKAQYKSSATTTNLSNHNGC